MRTMATAGRTVLFSAAHRRAVDGRDGALPDVLPEVVRLCRRRDGRVRGVAAIVVTPAAIVLLGERLDSWMCAASAVGCWAGPSR